MGLSKTILRKGNGKIRKGYNGEDAGKKKEHTKKEGGDNPKGDVFQLTERK